MHDYGEIDLKGKQVVVKAKTFYKAKASVRERTFVCSGGPGCLAIEGTDRRISGHWLADKMKDKIDSYSIERILE